MELQENIQLRMYAIMVGLGFLPVLVMLKLLGIYVSDRAELSAQGERQASTMVDIPAMRGSIYDRSGKELVVNAASYNLALDPTVEGYTEAVEKKLFDNLAVLTGQSEAYFRKKVDGRTSPKYVLLWTNLVESEKQVVDEWDVPGLLLVRTLTRRYNYEEMAAHVIGHLSRDGRGIDGLELQYEDYLRGEPAAGRAARSEWRNQGVCCRPYRNASRWAKFASDNRSRTPGNPGRRVNGRRNRHPISVGNGHCNGSPYGCHFGDGQCARLQSQ